MTITTKDLAVWIWAMLLIGGDVQGVPLTPGDILVSSNVNGTNGVVREYTPAGVLRQSWNVNPAPGGDFYVRGVAGDNSGRIQIYNGTFTASLTTLDPTSGTFTHHSFPGLSTYNSLATGSLVVADGDAYLSDMPTLGGNLDKGVVRFDLTNYAATIRSRGKYVTPVRICQCRSVSTVCSTRPSQTEVHAVSILMCLTHTRYQCYGL